MTVQASSKLAVCGGSPLCKNPLETPAWPPVLERTADRLREIYLSREWSFNSPTEQAFEQAFADYHGSKHAIFMVNGTVTLQCALGALGIGPGDEVIVPALTWMATAMAVHYVGATPVFVDSEADTLCMDPVKACEAITPRTKAMIPVHLFGSMANLDAILDLAREHDLAVVEDCAHMHGGKWRNRGVGSWGDIGSFSFQQSKTMSGGEGGICLTNDDELADRLYRQKHIGYGRGMKQGEVDAGPPQGMKCYNYRGTAFQAAILNDQLDELPSLIERYERAAARIQDRLSGIPGVRIQVRGKEASPQGYYGLVLLFDEGPLAKVRGTRIREAICAEGFPVAPSYGPVYQHLLYNMAPSQYRISGDTCPVAEITATDRVAVIQHPLLTSSDETFDIMGEVIEKVTEHAHELLKNP